MFSKGHKDFTENIQKRGTEREIKNLMHGLLYNWVDGLQTNINASLESEN